MSDDKKEQYRTEIKNILSSLTSIKKEEKQKLENILSGLGTRKAVLVLKELVIADNKRQSSIHDTL